MTLVALTFENGSLILIEYTASLKDSGKVIETTSQTTAQAHVIYDSDTRYGPKLVSIGNINYPVFGGLEKGLKEMSVGAHKLIELAPEDAWGIRDPKKVRMYSLRKLGKDAEQHSIGDSVEVDNKKGVIRYIGSGRVQVDFNHVYAGKTLIYDVTVKEHLEMPDEIISEILKVRLNSSGVKYKIRSDSLHINLTDDALDFPELSTVKRRIVRDVFRFLPHLDSAQFVEYHPNPSKAQPSEKITPDASDADLDTVLNTDLSDDLDDDLDLDDDTDLDDDLDDDLDLDDDTDLDDDLDDDDDDLDDDLDLNDDTDLDDDDDDDDLDDDLDLNDDTDLDDDLDLNDDTDLDDDLDLNDDTDLDDDDDDDDLDDDLSLDDDHNNNDTTTTVATDTTPLDDNKQK